MRNKVLRIKLRQNKANYRKEESVTNKMTYPLPPYSTIIGAIHNACRYDTYHPMDISIQGNFESMNEEIYTDQAFLNSTMDDRGILVKVKNQELMNEGYEIIAKALNSQGNSFRNGKTIDVVNETELEIYRNLLDLRDFYNNKNNEIKLSIKENKDKIKDLNKIIKEYDKKSEEYNEISDSIKNLKEKNKKIKNDFNYEKEINCTLPLSKYFTLTKSIRRYEVLYGVNLIIHVDSDSETLKDIYENINNLTAIGRSEDFVDVLDIRYVEIYDEEKNIRKLKNNNNYSYYVSTKALEDSILKYRMVANSVQKTHTRGTNYYINKDYNIDNKKRIFNKKRVSYISSFGINYSKLEESNNNFDKNADEDIYRIYLDEEGYLVNLM